MRGGPRGAMRGQDTNEVRDGGEVLVRRPTGWITECEVVCDWCGPAYVLRIGRWFVERRGRSGRASEVGGNCDVKVVVVMMRSW